LYNDISAPTRNSSTEDRLNEFKLMRLDFYRMYVICRADSHLNGSRPILW